MKRFFMALAALLAINTAAARADLVFEVGGVVPISTVSAVPGGVAGPVGNTVFLILPPPDFTTLINGAFVGLNPTTFSGNTLTITAVVSDALATQYTLVQTGVALETISMIGGPTALFSYVLTAAQVDKSDLDTITFSGTKVLVAQAGSTAAFDFSPFFAGGDISFTLSAPAIGANFEAILAGGGTLVATGGWEQTAPGIIPEPTTFALLGIALPIVGLYVIRRRRAMKAAA